MLHWNRAADALLFRFSKTSAIMLCKKTVRSVAGAIMRRRDVVRCFVSSPVFCVEVNPPVLLLKFCELFHLYSDVPLINNSSTNMESTEAMRKL